MIALDADTQFEPTTIARLARWFDDPTLGAVAGNAKVGNRVNLVTRWQALEYITAQNLERRALARLDAMTVVPGAVGAWRRAALAQVGGYPRRYAGRGSGPDDRDPARGLARSHTTNMRSPGPRRPRRSRALAKQRFRWAFGTLQCLWKHRARDRGRRSRAGWRWVGLPQAIAVPDPARRDLADHRSGAARQLRRDLISRSHAHGWAQTQPRRRHDADSIG